MIPKPINYYGHRMQEVHIYGMKKVYNGKDNHDFENHSLMYTVGET